MTVSAQVDGADLPGSRGLILLLGACSAIGPIATLLVVPALPSIRADLGATTAATQGVISSFLFAFAAGILFAGPLSDRYGRKPAILSGLVVFMVGCVMCALASTIGTLVGGRVVQAIGAAVTLAVARAVVGDLYRDWRLARALANLTMAMMLGTAIAPYVGGQITVRLGWHGTFTGLLAVAAVVTLLIWQRLPETHTSAERASGFAEIGRSSLKVLRNPRFFACAVDVGVIYAIYLVFIAVTPFVMSEMLGQPATEFGKYSLLLSLGFFLGNLYISRYGSARNMERLAQFGCGLQTVAALLALGFVLAGLTHPLWWFLPQLPLAFGQGLTLPHRVATAVRLAPGYAGVASSLIGFAQQVIAGLSVQAIGFASTDSAVPMLTLCAGLAVVSLLTMLGTRGPSAAGPAASPPPASPLR